MYIRFFLLPFLVLSVRLVAQIPNDFLSKEFHEERRKILRSKLPENSVVVVFANSIKNRSNDVDYLFHQNPNFYYLTGFREPNAVLVLFSEYQKDENGNTYNELIYVPKKNAYEELWHGKRLGVEGAVKELGFKNAKASEDFIHHPIDFTKFNAVFVEKFDNDHRNSKKKAEIFDLIESFKSSSNYDPATYLSKEKRQVYKLISTASNENSANVAQVLRKTITYHPNLKEDTIVNAYQKNVANTIVLEELKKEVNAKLDLKSNIDFSFLKARMAEMREIKTEEELKLLKKAVRISAIGQIEVMKAMQPDMSETEIQGMHEFIYKKYGATNEGYPSIVGSGNNGCVLHYVDNNRTKVENDLVLMDLGAEYRGYSADITRTIPANGKFTPEQKEIYELVLKAQKAGIAACIEGNSFWKPGKEAIKVINEGLIALGIISNALQGNPYFPHGTSHHLGLDVHDLGTQGTLKENMVITVEPGIYIPDGSPCDKKWWGIAIRIEDDILITSGKPQNLSKEVPKTVRAIEAMMSKKSVFNDFILPNID